MNLPVIVIGAGVGGLTTAALLTQNGHQVKILEKSSKVGGRTTSTKFQNHILDNGFHIMPFYKKSAIFEILKKLKIDSKLKLAKVDDIAFYSSDGFHTYPKGILDLLKLSLLPLKSRIKLLRILLPIAFTSISKTESWDNTPLTKITSGLDSETNAFFEAVCMLAFADSAEHISLGEFARTIIRANPFKGGTSEFAYPDNGGYDSICNVLSDYILDQGGEIHTRQLVKKIIVEDSKVTGVLIQNLKGSDELIYTNCAVISYPAYTALNQLFEKNIIPSEFVNKINKLNKTTSVVEVHFALKSKIDSRQVVFPVGKIYTTKGIFFISNITPSVSPPGEHLIIAGTPVLPEDTDNPQKIKNIVTKMKQEISSIYPEFQQSLLWERPMAWKLVESVVKEPGKVWKSKMPHTIKGIEGLYFVGDSTISYGIGTDSAAHSSLLCTPKIESFLKL
ncbi:MAG: NAD(P)/FAD-dependent oxidoreductase [Nitrosopumilus sp.]|nr:NAD(P)/FAD-dependent oxidoreductase [Nitrosopumilus sp.]